MQNIRNTVGGIIAAAMAMGMGPPPVPVAVQEMGPKKEALTRSGRRRGNKLAKRRKAGKPLFRV